MPGFCKAACLAFFMPYIRAGLASEKSDPAGQRNRYYLSVARKASQTADMQKIHVKVKSGKIFRGDKKVIYSQKETEEIKNRIIDLRK